MCPPRGEGTTARTSIHTPTESQQVTHTLGSIPCPLCRPHSMSSLVCLHVMSFLPWTSFHSLNSKDINSFAATAQYCTVAAKLLPFLESTTHFSEEKICYSSNKNVFSLTLIPHNTALIANAHETVNECLVILYHTTYG